MSKKMIYLTRPTEYLYSAIGAIINQYGTQIYDMSETKFIGIVMKSSNGTLNPDKIKIVYDQLMMEAGLQGKIK